MLGLMLSKESKVSLGGCHAVAHIQMFCVQPLEEEKAAAKGFFFFVICLFPCKLKQPEICLKFAAAVLNLLRCYHHKKVVLPALSSLCWLQLKLPALCPAAVLLHPLTWK